MQAHKLVLDDFDSPFKLIAIHCSLEGYRLAFLLNKILDTKLARTPEEKDHDIVTKAGTAKYALYTYKNQQKYCMYFLIGNRSNLQSRRANGTDSLFGSESFDSSPVYLLPQYKSVDFLFKIEEEGEMLAETELLNRIKEIPEVSTAYSIDTDDLKYKDNLIFD